MTIDEEKAALRSMAAKRRAGLDPAAGERLASLVMNGLRPSTGRVVAGVWPLPGEMDLRPLLHALFDGGYQIVLPETPPVGQPLAFRDWHPGCTMIRERFGTFRPSGEHRTPDWLFVPLLAFDRQGGRLGYGGGFYDRTLASLPDAVAVGFGYAAQEVSSVPMGEHDYRLTTIVTEAEIIRVAA